MFRLGLRPNPVLLTVGGLLLGVGGGLQAIFDPQNYAWSLPVGALIFGIGTTLSVIGIIRVTRSGAVFLDSWNSDLIYRAMSRADPKSTVSLLQTSFPEVTKLIGEIEQRLIQDDKQFRLRILLLNFMTASEVAKGRMRLRKEKVADHLREVETNIGELIEMKKRVDAAWAETRDGAKLKLEIRLYDFLPFGSHYQIGQNVTFVGLFWNTTSSVNGPMIRVTGTDSVMWKAFEKQFEEGWRHAQPHYPEGDTLGVAPTAAIETGEPLRKE
jgi:hypothetical protein